MARLLEPGEAWSDAVIADVEAMPAEETAGWVALFRHMATFPAAGQPSPRWRATATAAVDRIGRDRFRAFITRWFPLVDKPRSRPIDTAIWDDEHNTASLDLQNVPDAIHPRNVALLRGLVQCGFGSDDRDRARATARLALSAYRKAPGIGPRPLTLGNTCVAVLASMPGVESVGQLAMLKNRVKATMPRRAIQQGLDQAATRLQLPRDAVEELAVPTYGLDDTGHRSIRFGDSTADLGPAPRGDGLVVHWSKGGKPLKTAPAAAKQGHAEEWRDLQNSVKDAAGVLAARREALEQIPLLKKFWTVAAWRARYLDHPLIGLLARRLIWTLTTAEGTLPCDVSWHDGRLLDRAGSPVEPAADTAVTLWHPIGRPVAEVLAWRDRLEALGIRQPFKQAHREVYLLTDAERTTATYSNRFAAHILRQHQFHALCAARGWQCQLRIRADSASSAPSRELPAWGLRAEFWVEGVDAGHEAIDSIAYTHVATDQVRFYRTAADPAARPPGERDGGRPGESLLPLDEVPALALSEVLRDIDLFVGVASVGNDPTWADGGSTGAHRHYWQSYAFGDLSASAGTRREVLRKLVPRLKIAERCTLSDKFLVVRGDLRTYKIHLGSGNILMEPNDQYLCIVPQGSAARSSATESIFLPFEGDRLLSIILSKALLLAADARITDPTITRQISRDA